MEINGNEVSSNSGTNLAYKAHMDVLLGVSKDVKIDKLKDTMLYFDEEIGLAKVNKKADGGAYAKKHAAFIINSAGEPSKNWCKKPLRL